MSRKFLLLPTNWSAAVAVLVIGACSNPDIAAPPESNSAIYAGLASVGDLPPNGVEVCKVGPAGTTATFNFSVAGPGVVIPPQTFTLEALPIEQGCIDGRNRRVIWVGASPRTEPLVNTVVSVAETGATPGIVLDRIYVFGSVEGARDFGAPITSVTATVNYDVGATILFKNVGTPTTGGAQGCTPGYWKQSQHFDSWTSPYAPTTQFGAVFANAFPGMTLLQVLGQGGGGLKALGRHSVAALLNTASGGIDYGMSTAAVISSFNAVYASGGDPEVLKDRFAALNERGCPLN